MTINHPGAHRPANATILTGPVGCGKTQAALNAILDARQSGSAFAPIWVVLATREQAHAFRQRLLTHAVDQVLFGVEFFTIHDLYARILELAGDPQRQIEGPARFRVLRHVATDLQDQGELETYRTIADRPGFITQVSGLIYELKQALILPEDFAAVARQRGPKDRDLARLYTGYQALLQQKRLVDRHGAGWLALEHLDVETPLPLALELLIIDGFDQFNRIHARLLASLAHRANRTILTLTHAATDRQARRLRRFEQTRQRVLIEGGGLWIERALPDPSSSSRPPGLDHLVKAVFDSAASQYQSTTGAEHMRLIEAPDVRRETAAVMRRVKRLLLDGAPPETIAILARRLDQYGSLLRELARAYGVPLVVRQESPLRENPAIAALLTLLDLHAGDFRRRDLLDMLHAPYFAPPQLDREQIAVLERISLERKIVRGRDVWLSACRAANRSRREDEDDDPRQGADAHDASALADALTAFMDRITPPARGTAAEFVTWIEQLIGPDPQASVEDAATSLRPDAAAPDHLGLLGQVRATDDAAIAARDITALHAFMRILSGLRGAYALLEEDDEPQFVTWADFRAELAMTIDEATVTPAGGLSRLGRVLATDVLEARGLPHDHIFLLGLVDGIFPGADTQDAFYSDRERQTLAAQGLDLQMAGERTDDMSLFYQAIGLARRTLTLSRFTIDDAGMPCPPSVFWSAVCAVVDIPAEAMEQLPIGAAPTLDQAATLDEAAIATAAAFSHEQVTGALAPTAVYNALLAEPSWRAVLRGRAIEAQRDDRAAEFDAFSGILSEPSLIADVARRLGPDRVWSASQLNAYGLCPFRFFASRMLNLQDLNEPEEGLDSQQLGSVNHAILNETYRRLAAEGLDLAPGNTARALAILREAAAKVFADAPESFAFRPTAVWNHEQDNMLRRLEWLVQQDLDGTGPFKDSATGPVTRLGHHGPRRPFLHEAAFGFQDQPPLTIDGPAGPLLARGKIDRMDRAGDRVIVIDYKTGSTRHPVPEMADGIDFQMMLYLLAAQAMLTRIDASLSVAGGFFWHITSRAISGEVGITDKAIRQAREHLHAHVRAARQGQFPVQPRKLQNGACARFCEFGPLCRVSRAYHHKALADSGDPPDEEAPV